MSNGDLDAGASKRVLCLFICVQYKTYQDTLKLYKYASKLQTVLSPALCVYMYVFVHLYVYITDVYTQK